MSIDVTVEDHVARVTIDRPDVLNAVDDAAEAELMRIWDAIEADRDVRVVVLTGAGERAFCAGADMKQAATRSGLEYWAMPRPGGFGGIALRETLDVPVIARVNGLALGGGFEMVLGCDIVVAVEEGAASACPSRGSAACRSTAACCCCSARSRYLHAMGMLLTGRRIRAERGAAARAGQRGGAAPGSSTPRSSAGSPTSSPARRCRCGRSSRWSAWARA